MQRIPYPFEVITSTLALLGERAQLLNGPTPLELRDVLLQAEPGGLGLSKGSLKDTFTATVTLDGKPDVVVIVAPPERPAVFVKMRLDGESIVVRDMIEL